MLLHRLLRVIQIFPGRSLSTSRPKQSSRIPRVPAGRLWTAAPIGAVLGGAIFLQLKAEEPEKPDSKPAIKLVYFDVQAKGELIRLLLAAGNFDFEDKRLSFSEWPGDVKNNTPFGQIPVLYWDKEELAQTLAMARFVAKKGGLAGNTDMEFAKADMIACHYEEIWKKLPKMKFAKTQAEREELANEFLKEFLPAWLQPMETILQKKGGGWFAGDGATFADIAIMCALDFVLAEEEMSFKDMNNVEERRKILDLYPLLKQNYINTCELPFVAEWKKKRPVFEGL